MKVSHLYLFLSATILMNACTGQKGKGRLFNSENIQTSGVVFTGILPCADCEGIQTMVRINENNTYYRESMHNGKSDEIFISEGTYVWKKNSICLTSVDSDIQVYLFKDNKLFLVKEPKINADTSTQMYLQFNKDELQEKYWKLLELNGKLVTVNSDNKREPHIIFKILNNRVVGNSGCNGFSSTYRISKSNGIHISDILSTKMACMEVTIENEFFTAIENANGYFIVSDTLNLSRNHQTIARFKNEPRPPKY
jgi:copper homeostasis protein (lipoprotein)